MVLLKLYAAGSQDGWDVEQLLDAAESPRALIDEVERGLADLPDGSRALWERIRGQG